MKTGLSELYYGVIIIIVSVIKAGGHYFNSRGHCCKWIPKIAQQGTGSYCAGWKKLELLSSLSIRSKAEPPRPNTKHSCAKYLDITSVASRCACSSRFSESNIILIMQTPETVAEMPICFLAWFLVSNVSRQLNKTEYKMHGVFLVTLGREFAGNFVSITDNCDERLQCYISICSS